MLGRWLEKLARCDSITRIPCREECGMVEVDGFGTCIQCGGETDEELRTRIKERISHGHSEQRKQEEADS